MPQKPKEPSGSSPKSADFLPRQGYCYLVDMNPPRHSKPGKLRPAVVLQATDVTEQGTPGVVIVPLTSQLKDSNILRVRITPSSRLKLSKASDALVDQIHTIDRQLFIEILGKLNEMEFKKIKSGVEFLLNCSLFE